MFCSKKSLSLVVSFGTRYLFSQLFLPSFLPSFNAYCLGGCVLVLSHTQSSHPSLECDACGWAMVALRDTEKRESNYD